MSLFSNFSFAQTQSLVSVKPIIGQGYLILDKMNNPNIDSWSVQINKLTSSSDGTVPVEEIISTETLPSGINYLFIPIEYRHQSFIEKYTVNVRGYGNDGAILVSENNIHLNDNNNTLIYEAPNVTPYMLTDCRKTCLSGQYAYTIQQYLKVTSNFTGLSRFQVEETYKAFDPQSQTANPYFWYSHTDIPSPTQTPPFISGPNGNVTVYDPAGNPLIGLVFGHQKTLGVWEGQSIIMTNGQHNIGLEFCSEASWPFNQAMLLINGSADFSQPANLPDLPFLECVPANNSSGGGGTVINIGDPTPDETWGGFVTFCYENGNPVPCADPTNPQGFGGNALNPEIVDLILIKDLNDNTIAPITINVIDLYNANGEFTGLNLNLPPSLYSFGFMFKESGFWAKIGEIMTTTSFSTTQADMLDVNVFPTPMTGDKYTLDMKAHATLKFDYELRDFTGNLLVSRKFVIHKDHEKSQKMNEKNIPEGFLVHRFIFDDGSVKTIQTQKQ